MESTQLKTNQSATTHIFKNILLLFYVKASNIKNRHWLETG